MSDDSILSEQLPARYPFQAEDLDEVDHPGGLAIECWCYECLDYVHQVGIEPTDPSLDCGHEYPDALQAEHYDYPREKVLQLKIARDYETYQHEQDHVGGWRVDSLRERILDLKAELDDLRDNGGDAR